MLHNNIILIKKSQRHEVFFCLMWKLLILLKSYCLTWFIILNFSLLLFLCFPLKSSPFHEAHFISAVVKWYTKVIKSIWALEADISGS